MVERFGLRWRIGLSEVEYKYGTQSLHLPYLSPINVIKFLLSECPEILFGGFTEDTDIMALLSSWWDAYRANHPNHEVYALDPGSLSTTIPILLYGDEGRGRRRGQTCVVSLETVFGLSSAENFERQTCVDCSCVPDPRVATQYASVTQPVELEYIHAASTTMKEHSFLSRVPLFLLPCTVYKEHPDLIDYMHDHISRELCQLYYQGLDVRSRVWKVAFLGLKGDLKWLAQRGHLDRYYGKKGRKKEQGICPECLGGVKRLPYEDVGPEPCWARTLYKWRPWPTSSPPGFSAILPFDRSGESERALRRDIFHITRLGVWRHFVGSAVVTLIHLNIGFCEDGASNARDVQLQRAHGFFRLWCSMRAKSPALRSFTPALFSWKTWQCYPWINAKGSDVALCVSWLNEFIPVLLSQANARQKELLQVMHQVAVAMDAIAGLLYGHRLMLSRACAAMFLENATKVLNGYSWLAQKSKAMQLCAWAMIPKVHMFKHFAHEAHLFLQGTGKLWVSPLAFSCEVNEDLIGRLARLSRRVDSRTMERRVLQLYLIKARALHIRWRKRRQAGISRPRKKICKRCK